MQKKHLSLAVLLFVTAVLISGCTKKPGNQSANVKGEQDQNQASNQATGMVNPSGEYSINELFTLNKPIKCTWKESLSQGQEVTNILYLNGKKFYQDVTMGDTGHAYTVSNGEYLYIWNDFNNVASKMKFTEIKTSPQPGEEKSKATAGLDQKHNFVCENWSVDDSIFNPPQDKNFKDITGEMEQAVEGLKDENLEKAKQQVCDLCQKAPNQEAKDECLKNAQCSQ